MADPDTNLLLGSGYEFGTSLREGAERVREEARHSYQNTNAGDRAWWGRIVGTLDEFLAGNLRWGSRALERKFYPHVVGGPPVERRILERWSARLIVHGRRLDDQLDALLSEVTALPFNWQSSKRDVTRVLDVVLVRREDVRAFEREVEDFLEGVTETAEHGLDVLPVTQLLNQLQRTYDRVYDLAALKLNTITATRATYASILIATIAAVIAVFK